MKTNLKHILSITVLAIFIISAFASLDIAILGGLLNSGWDTKEEFLGNRTQRVTTTISKDTIQAVEVLTGQFDGRGRWTGDVSAVQGYWNLDSSFYVQKEWKINFVAGKKHGKGVLYYKKTPPGNLKIDTLCYNMDKKVDCEDFVELRRDESSAYEIFAYRYPLSWYDFDAFGFDEVYMKSLMDSIQLIINSYEFDAAKFDEYYDNSIDEMSVTPYDSLIRLNEDFFIRNLLDGLKNGTFRMAVFDRYYDDQNSTFEVLNTTYPDYILNMEELEIPMEDLQVFCSVYDSLLSSYAPLDINSELFPFDLDSLMYKAFNDIDSLENEALEDVKNAVLIYSIVEFYFDADPIRESQREAYFLNNEVITPPVLTTSFKSNLPNNEAEIEGFVISDGGATIEQRGIAWAKHDKPSIEDETKISNGTLGSFTVIINELTPGETYFARSFAKYEDGIAYGNTARFTAEEVSSANVNIEQEKTGFTIYPSPASSKIYINFDAEMTDLSSMKITDIYGKTVLNISNLVDIGQGERIEINITSLSNGIYNCISTDKKGKVIANKFVVIN